MDCRMATTLPAATPPPPAMADALIIEAAMEPAAMPPEVNPSAVIAPTTAKGAATAPAKAPPTAQGIQRLLLWKMGFTIYEYWGPTHAILII